MAKEATAMSRIGRTNSTTQLAKFFPEATPVRMPVRLTRLGDSRSDTTETTMLEFGTPREVLFASTLPLEFGDMLRLQNSDGTLDIEACVVALQYNGERTAVAARFAQPLLNWIVKS